MANYKIAYDKIMGYEVGYSNDKNDRGGETWAGVARNFYPQWSGWSIIDSYNKNDVNFEKNLKKNEQLAVLVKDFYKPLYWDVFKGDEIKIQDIATELFDICVNLGQGKATKFFQLTLNILNRNEKLYKDIIVDGNVGNVTISTFNTFLEKDNNTDLFLKILNILQGSHYIDIMKSNQTQEDFARGWFKRVEINKTI